MTLKQAQALADQIKKEAQTHGRHTERYNELKLEIAQGGYLYGATYEAFPHPYINSEVGA